MAEKIVFDITADIDSLSSTVDSLTNALQSKSSNESISNLISGLKELRTEADSISTVFEKIPTSLQSTLTKTVNSIKNGFDSIIKDNPLTMDEKQLGQRIGLSAGSFSTLMSGLKEIYNFTESASDEQIKKLNKNFHDISNSVKEVSNGFLGRRGTGPASAEAVFKSFFGQTERKEAFAAFLQDAGTYGRIKKTKAEKAIIKGLANLVVPRFFQDDYLAAAEKYSGGKLNRSTVMSRGLYGTYKERLPESLRDMPYLESDLKIPDKEKYEKTITESQYKQITDLARKNEALKKALVLTGLASYQNDEKKGAASFMMTQRTKMTVGDVSNLVARMFYDVYKPAAESNAVNFAPLNTSDAKKITRIANRASKESVQAYEALNVLQDITGGLAPTTAYASRIAPESHVNYLGGIGAPAQESYVVLSLTPEDFKNNKYPKQRVVKYGKEAVDSLKGESSYIMMNRSRMTEWAGMHGNRTFGNGIIGDFLDENNTDIRKNLPMVIIDYSADWMKTDENGNLVQNTEVTKQVEELFKKNKRLKYTYQGKNHMYAYPSVTRDEDGVKKSYVPITMKGGGAYLIAEDTYKAKSKEYLEQYGVNALDNFISANKAYDDFKNMNKDFEAINRNLTPSIPFSEIGAAIDGRKTRFSVVDFEKYFGIDGAMFAMPGLTPGGDATIRAPFMNMKGVMQSLNWKKLLTKMYGLKENDPFYVPGYNLPKELEALYQKGGLKAIKEDSQYGKSNYQHTLDTYFEDIMKADVLVSPSLIKTDVMNGLSGRAASRFFADRYNAVKDPADLFRLVKTAEQLRTTGQMALGLQMAEKISFTPGEIVKNTQEWRRHIEKMKNDAEYQKQHIFNGDSYEDKFFGEDPVKAMGLSSVQTRISEAIKTAENSMHMGLPFANKDLEMRLALVHPGSFLNAAGDKSGYAIKNKALYNMLRPDNDTIVAAGILSSISGGRWPSGYNENFALNNNKLLSTLAKNGRFGLNKEAIYLTPERLAAMGGGDFDGDTVQMILGQLAEAAKRSGEELRNKLAENNIPTKVTGEEKKLPIPKNTKMNESYIAQLGYRQLEQSVKLGGVSNAMQNLSQLDWTDDATVQQYGPAMAETRMLYDIDSVFQKTGVEAEWKDAAKNASYLGRPLLAAYKDVFRVLSGSVPKTELPNLAKFNFASIFNAPSALMLSGASKNGLSNETMNALLNMERDLNGINVAALNTDSAEGAYKTYLDASLKAKIKQMGTGAIIDDATYADLVSKLETAKQTLKHERTAGLTPDDTLDELEKQIGRQRSELNFLKLLGLTSENIRNKKGYYRVLGDNQSMSNYSVFGQQMQNSFDVTRQAEEVMAFQLKAMAAQNLSIQAAIKGDVIKGFTEQEIGEQQAKAVETIRNMRFSYSNLSKFKENPVEWIDRYINGKQEEKTPQMVIGDAFHKSAQYWALSRIKEQYDTESAKNHTTKKDRERWKTDKMFYEAALNDAKNKVVLSKNASADDAFVRELTKDIRMKNLDGTETVKKLFEKDGNGFKSALGNEGNMKIEAARAFLKKLDTIYSRDEYDVMGAETRFTEKELQELLPQKDPKSSTSPINFIGFTDMVLRNKKTGKLELVDWKPRVTGNSEKDKMQLQIYAEAMNKMFGTNVDAANYVGYLDGQRQNVFSGGVNEEQRVSIKNKMQDLFTSISSVASATGFNEKIIDLLKSRRVDWTQFKTPQDVLNAAFNLSEANLNDVITKSGTGNVILPGDRATVRGRLLAKRMGLSEEQQRGLTDADIVSLIQSNILSDKKLNKSGQIISAGIAMGDDARDLTKKFEETSSGFIISSLKSDRDRKYNPWSSRRRAVDKMNEEIERFKIRYADRGIDESIINKEVEVLNAQKDTALDEYSSSIKKVAVNDMYYAAKDFDELLNKPTTTSSLSKYADMFDSIAKKIETAKQAYEQLQKDVADGTVSLTDDEKAKIEEQKTRLEASSTQLRDKYKEEILAGFNTDLEKKRNYAIGGELSLATEREKAAKDYRQYFTDQRQNIKKLKEQNVISAAEATQMIYQLRQTYDLDGYMKEYDLAQEKRKQEKIRTFDERTNTLIDETKYGHISKGTSINKAIQNFKATLSGTTDQLEKDYKKGYYDKDEYEKRKAVLANINVDDYENLLYNQELTKGQAQLRSYNRMLSTHGFSFGRQSMYSRMKDQAYAREDSLRSNLSQLRDSQDLWQGRADAIKAKYTTTDANGASIVDESALKADANYQQATSMVVAYGNAIKGTESELAGFANAHKGLTAVINSVVGSMQNMVNMYARQFVRKMISSATQFVKTYDSTMTEIQMVTLKTDSEIASLGETMLQTAEDLKVSFSDVSKVTIELYRQGLDDEAVADRSEQLLKFSKVTGMSISEANKMMTVALSSGLVENAEHVVDAVTVLGDAAATNAQQITKGLQKSLPAAEVAGVSFEELNAMLTVITANTQLSGSVAGTTMRNVMSRMTRAKSGDVVYDENGNMMNLSSLATVLKSVGIEVVDGVTDQFREIAAHWDDLTDMQKNQIAYELGGTQQYSNVVAVVEAFAEKDEITGESQIDKYLRLQEESEGAVSEKYDIYEESLTAKTTDLSNAFNNLVAAIAGITTEGNAAGSALGIFIDALTFCIEGLEKIAPVITALMVGLMALAAFTTAGKIALVVAGIGAAVNGISSFISSLKSQKNQQYEASKAGLQQSMDTKSANEQERNSLIEEYAEILNRVKENGATNDDLSAYNSVVKKLNNMGFSSVSAASSLDDLNKAAQGADAAITGLKNAAEQKSSEEALSIVLDARNLINSSGDIVEEVNAETEEEAGKKAAIYYKLSELALQNVSSSYLNGRLIDGVSVEDFFGFDGTVPELRDAIIKTARGGSITNMQLSDGRYLTESVLEGLDDLDLWDLLMGNGNLFSAAVNAYLDENADVYQRYVQRASEYVYDPKTIGYDEEKLFDAYYEAGAWKNVLYPFEGGTLEFITKDMTEEERKAEVKKRIAKKDIEAWGDAQPNSDDYKEEIGYGQMAANREPGDIAFWTAVSGEFANPAIGTRIYYDNRSEYNDSLEKMQRFISTKEGQQTEATASEKITAGDYNREQLLNAVTSLLGDLTLDDGTPLANYAEAVIDAEIEKMRQNAQYKFLQDYIISGINGDPTGVDFSKIKSVISDFKQQESPAPDDTSTSTDILSTAAAAASSGEAFKTPLQTLYNQVSSRYGTRDVSGLISYLNNDLSETDKKSLESMLQHEDYQDIATALANFATIDENGNVSVNENTALEDWANLLNVIAAHSTSLDIFATQTDKDKRTLALDMASGLVKANNKASYWQSPDGYSSNVAESMRTAFKEIIGEEDTLKYLNGEMNIYGSQFVNNAIGRYGTGIDAFTSEELPGVMSGILGELEGKTPQEQLEYIEGLGSGLNDVLGNSYEGWTKYREGITAATKGIEGYDSDKLLDDLKDSVDESAVANLYKYEDALEDIVSTVSSLKKGGKDASSAVTSLTNSVRTLSNARWALEKYKSGDKSDDVLSALSSSFGYNTEDLENATGIELQSYIDNMDVSLADQTSDLELQAESAINTLMGEILAENPEYTFTANINADGSYDLSGLVAAMNGLEGDAAAMFASLVQALASMNADVAFNTQETSDGYSITSSSVNLSKTSTAKRSGGGGGGGKSKAESLVDEQKKKKQERDHMLKMIQYRETEYQNADQLTNYGSMLEYENKWREEQIPIIESNIEALKTQLKTVTKGSDDWYTLTQAIMDNEEEIEEHNKAIDENTQKIEENEQAILKLHTDLENTVDTEIKNRIQKERDMNDGTVDMQNTVLDAIKQRYQDEWDLIKKDIEKKKQALEDEKSLIDERLNARKEAEDEAEKYEELAEYKKQLALISMDSTRTKDAASLREKIAELEKEIGWDIAEKEAENAQNEIQDQIDAYDEFETQGDEDLEDLLSDANNFAEEVNGVMKLNQDELFEWLKNNCQEYANSLTEAQRQTLYSWEDTYKKMMGITDTYWTEIADVLSSKESFMNFMMGSDDYINSSEDMQAQLRYQYEDAYDKWIDALIDDWSFSHEDNWGDGGTASGSGSGSSSSSKLTDTEKATLAKTLVSQLQSTLGRPWTILNPTEIGADRTSSANMVQNLKNGIQTIIQENLIKNNPKTVKAFATGGLANFTGPAWLDGSASKPERILNAQQTASFDRLVDVLDDMNAAGFSFDDLRKQMGGGRISLPNLAPSLGKDAFNASVANVGTVNVTIEEAELNDDRDYDEIAQIVGQKFAKEISRQGVNLARYNF